MADHLDAFFASLTAASLAAQFDPLVERYFAQVVADARSGAGGVWLESADSTALVLAHNVGGAGAEIDGRVAQPLETGLVSKAFKEGTTVCHRGFFGHKEQSKAVDRELNQVTAHQVATPFSLFGRKVGALTVIQTADLAKNRRMRWGYDDDDIARVELATAVLGRLLEFNFTRAQPALLPSP